MLHNLILSNAPVIRPTVNSIIKCFTLCFFTDQQEPNLADISILRNTASLSDDLKIITACPELCDVIFFCGEEREPVYGVRAVLAARSR